MRAFNASLTVRDSIFSLNTGSPGGGAIRFVTSGEDADVELLIEGSRFANNGARIDASNASTPTGGAVIASIGGTSTAIIRNSDFSLNAATGDEDTSAFAGALRLGTQHQASAVVQNCLFEGNRAVGEPRAEGGGVWFSNWGTGSFIASDLTFLDNTIGFLGHGSGGDTNAGAAAFLSTDTTSAAELVVERIVAMGNGVDDGSSTESKQVSIRADTGRIILRSSLLHDGLQSGVLATAENGGAAWLTHLTITGHPASGVVTDRESALDDISLGNSIVWNQAANLVENGLATSQVNNRFTDPLFVDDAGGDYRLAEGSPAIDAGSAAAPGIGTTDLDGLSRISGAAPDQGAYETGPPMTIFSDGFESGDALQWDAVVP